MTPKTKKSRLKTETYVQTQTFKSSGFDCEKARKEVANIATEWLNSNKYPIMETHEHTHLDIKNDRPFFEVQITFTYTNNS